MSEANRIDIRPATADDIPALVDLMADFYAESAFPLDRDWAARSFAALFADPARNAAWLASLDGQPIGHTVLCSRHSMEFGGLDGSIDDLYVIPAARRRGVGRALLDRLVAHARALGVLALHVEVAPDNTAAQALYAALGLQLTPDRQLLVTRL
ncbi:MAG: GNAT family N-acetyltransferase [Candidatus Didemnitutus sp.]|nr:GNAT family N-acetyltransferase [Candidatus Didemnitutus sp.]